MQFYRIETIITECDTLKDNSDRKVERDFASELAQLSESFYQKSGNNCYIFGTGLQKSKLMFGVISQIEEDIDKLFGAFVKTLDFKLIKNTCEEITFRSVNHLLNAAERNCFINDTERILNEFGIKDISGRYSSISFGEALIKESSTKEELCAYAKNILFSNTLCPEIERIYANEKKIKAKGHPVHYIIRTDDLENRKQAYRTLLSALYNNERIKSRRYCFVDYNEESCRPDNSFDALYKSCIGGAVVIRYGFETGEENIFGNPCSDIISVLCETAHKYKNEVLTVICLPCESGKFKEDFLSHFGYTSFIELNEDIAFGETAEEYLKNKALLHRIRPDKKLMTLENDDKGYRITELNRKFDEWFDGKLRNTIYPQYKDAQTTKSQIKKDNPKGSGYERLQTLIGLGEAKKVMNQALNFYKSQKLFADRGIKTDRISMHMVFTGNPGTAKTTVARLFAQIMKENGLLSRGGILEVGRADLVGKYVGHTAPLVKRAFKEALGGVLFIDEAYSLVDDRSGMYGDEAINTIVQEMENHRDDIVVIFAGYPDKMEEFINKNPGLRSRIAFHIPFEDYSSDELCKISALIAKEKGMELSQEAVKKLDTIFEIARQTNDFGNGRFARNVIEKARMAQANRLVNMDFELVTNSDIVTIKAEDIEVKQQEKKKMGIKIGFAS